MGAADLLQHFDQVADDVDRQRAQWNFVHESFSCRYWQWMSTTHIRTAADLVRFRAGLRIECDSCGNTRTLDGFEASKINGTKPLSSITSRLKCSRCGERRAKVVVLS